MPRKPVAFYTRHSIGKKQNVLLSSIDKIIFWSFSRENKSYDKNQLLGPLVTGMYGLAVDVSRVQ